MGKRTQALWLRYLTEIRDNNETIPAELLANPDLEEAVEYLHESAFSREELAGYDRYWDAISSERTLLAAALRDGYSEGVAKGMVEGIAAGKAEQALEMARRMLANGFDQQTVAELTGLTAGEISSILAE